MAALFKKEKKNPNLEYFTFIWYKVLDNKGTKIYTQPFRTKVQASSYEKAREKVIDFALSQMKLVVVPENKYNETELANLQKNFEVLNTEIEALFSKFEKEMKNSLRIDV